MHVYDNAGIALNVFHLYIYHNMNMQQQDNSEHQQQQTELQQQQQGIIKSGWLIKQGGVVKSWLRRWFVIRGDKMFYYTSDDESKLLGSIPLTGNRVFECPYMSRDPDKFHFVITPGE